MRQEDRQAESASGASCNGEMTREKGEEGSKVQANAGTINDWRGKVKPI